MNTGGCLCGAIRYEAAGPLTPVTYCHCSKCRRWHGHVGAYSAVDREHFRLTAASGLAWFDVSATIRRGFCAKCGSSMFWDESTLPKISLCAGTLDAPTGIREKAHIYVASAGDYYAIHDDLPRHDTFPGNAS